MIRKNRKDLGRIDKRSLGVCSFCYKLLFQKLENQQQYSYRRKRRRKVAVVSVEGFVKLSQPGLMQECLVLFQPGGTFSTGHFQLNVELLESLLQLLLVSSVVCSDSIVEQDELVMQHLHLMEREDRQ